MPPHLGKAPKPPLHGSTWTIKLELLLDPLQSHLEDELSAGPSASSMQAANAASVLRCCGADIVDGAGNVVRLKGINW